MDSESPDNHPSKEPSLLAQPEPGERKKLIELSKPIKVGFVVALIALAGVGLVISKVWNKADSVNTLSQGADSSEIKERKQVTAFDLMDADGKTTPFSAYKGKVVILSFWASWCTPCLVELPTFAQIKKKFGSEDLVIVPVNVDDGDVGKIFAKEFWAKNSFDFPSYFDATKQTAELFEIDTLPANFVIDREGRIVLTGFGVTDWNDPETVGIVEGLVNER